MRANRKLLEQTSYIEILSMCCIRFQIDWIFNVKDSQDFLHKNFYNQETNMVFQSFVNYFTISSVEKEKHHTVKTSEVLVGN